MRNEPTILLAEDDPDDVFLVRRALLASGLSYRLEVARDGEEALQYLTGHGPYADRDRFPAPVLLLLDLEMPRVSGFELLKKVREDRQFRSLPTIVFTASSLSPDVALAYRLGANSFITKPTEISKLTAVLREAVLFWIGKPASPLDARP